MFKKRETLLQNIAFMAVVTAINTIAMALAALFPIAGVFIFILLPFFSAMVANICKWRYYPIYAFATIGVALAATFWNTASTVFYLIPSIITGFLFALPSRLKLKDIYTIFLTSIAQCGLTFLLIPIINGIYGIDIIEQGLRLFKLSTTPNIHVIVPSIIYLLSLAQIILSYIVLSNEIKKFNFDSNGNKGDACLKIIGLIISLLVIPFVYFASHVSYLFMLIALFLTIYEFIEIIIAKKKGLIIFFSIALISGFVLVFALYNVIIKPYALLLINTSNILIFSILLINLYNVNRAKKLC